MDQRDVAAGRGYNRDEHPAPQFVPVRGAGQVPSHRPQAAGQGAGGQHVLLHRGSHSRIRFFFDKRLRYVCIRAGPLRQDQRRCGEFIKFV